MRNAFASKMSAMFFLVFARRQRKKPREMRPGRGVWEALRALERRPRAVADHVTCLEPSARVLRRPDDPSSPPPPFLILTDVSLPPFFIFREVRAQASGAASSLDMGGKVRANLLPATPRAVARDPRGLSVVSPPPAPSACRTTRRAIGPLGEMHQSRTLKRVDLSFRHFPRCLTHHRPLV